jgi:hypothetical protein
MRYNNYSKCQNPRIGICFTLAEMIHQVNVLLFCDILVGAEPVSDLSPKTFLRWQRRDYKTLSLQLRVLPESIATVLVQIAFPRAIEAIVKPTSR